MPRALNLLREATVYRKACFSEGLKRRGFDVVSRIDNPEPGDVVVTWNAYSHFGDEGRRFIANGARHLVVENGPLGKQWNGKEWFSVAEDAVALTGGQFADLGPERWDSWGVELGAWRQAGGECVILGQRGIGAPGVASPQSWADSVRGRIGGRVRPHPGRGEARPLDADLAAASEVVTWSSAAAVLALTMGIPVWHAHPEFVMASAARPLHRRDAAEPKRDDVARLAAFRRLAWCMWTLEEVSAGEPFECL